MSSRGVENNAISLLRLNQMVKEGIRRSFPSRLWVIAEISQMNIASTGHCYLELIERNETTQYIAAKCSATIWKSGLDAILRRFSSATGTNIKGGMKILAYTEVSYHEVYGISLNISDIDPSFTLGELEMQRRATIKKLKDDGDMDRNGEIPIPELPQRVAVVSSEKAAGYGDFMDELHGNEYGYSFTTELFHATMQGNDAEASIISALANIYQRSEEFDLIVIIRGGGSSIDLSCFDSYTLSKMVSYAPLAVISGIGHDRDQSIVDMCAAVSVKTPTAVARLLIDKFLEYENSLNDLQNYLTELLKGEVSSRIEKIDNYSRQLHNIVLNVVKDSSIYFGRVEQRLHFLSKNIIEKGDRTVDEALGRLNIECKAEFLSSQSSLNTAYATLKSRSSQIIINRKSNLELTSSKIDSYNPKHIFALGYALVKAKSGALKSTKEVQKGENITINLSDGKLDAIITDITNG